MKTLFILRHAKSSWENPDWSDFERPLNKRGLEAAPLMGETMRKNQFLPDLILSSPAKRAEQTAQLIKKAADFCAEIQFDERIYEASPARLLEVIAERNEKNESLMLIGHNPGLEGLLRYLIGETHPMATATLAVVDLPADKWNKINHASGNLRFLIRPRELE